MVNGVLLAKTTEKGLQIRIQKGLKPHLIQSLKYSLVPIPTARKCGEVIIVSYFILFFLVKICFVFLI
jgi:hypothetical protein